MAELKTCGHQGQARRTCPHLVAGEEHDYAWLFDGAFEAHAWVCLTCRALESAAEVTLEWRCSACETQIEADGFWEKDAAGIWGTPEPTASQDTWQIEFFPGPEVGAPLAISAQDDGWWLLSGEGALLRVLADGTLNECARPPLKLDTLGESPALTVSACGAYAAAAGAQFGALWAIETGALLKTLDRGDYHSEQTQFPLLFIQRDERPVLVYASDWNRLEAYDVQRASSLTPWPAPSHKEPGYFDYFFGRLSGSLDGTRLASGGWHWHPVGVIHCWDVAEWLAHEGKLSPSIGFADRDYSWDEHACWLDDRRMAVWGFGNDDLNLIDAVSVFDTVDDKLLTVLPGVPRGPLYHTGGQVLSLSATSGLTVWDLASGCRVGHFPEITSGCYAPEPELLLSVAEGRLRRIRLRGR